MFVRPLAVLKEAFGIRQAAQWRERATSPTKVSPHVKHMSPAETGQGVGHGISRTGAGDGSTWGEVPQAMEQGGDEDSVLTSV